MKSIKLILFFGAGTLAAVLLSGCATAEQLAKNMSSKNVNGSGLITDNRIGIDPETKSPVLKSVVISGDFQTIKADGNYINFKQESSGSWYNAQNKTEKTTLTITTDKNSNLADVLKYAIGVIDKIPKKENSEIEN